MKLKEQYWLSSGIINLLQNFSNVFFGIGSFFILVRLLSTFDYGAWAIFMQTVTIIELTRNGLIQNAMIKFMAGAEKEKHAQIITASLVISATITVLFIVLSIFFSGYIARLLNAPSLERVFYLYNITFVVSGFLTLFCCIEQANLKYTANFSANFVRQGVFLVYLVVLYFMKTKVDLVSLVYAQMVCVLLSVLVAWYYVRPYLHFHFEFSARWVREIFNYGKYSFGTSVSSLLAGTVDQWMLAALRSPAASGAFRVAISVMNMIDIPTNTIAVIVFPQSAKRLETGGKEAVKYLYEKSVGTIIAILVPAVLFLYIFDNLVIDILATEKYASAVPILNVTLLYCLLIPYGRQFGVILDSIGKTKITFYNVVIFATLNLVLNYFFIKAFGVIGAAYATLCSNVVGFIIAQVILHKILKVNVFNTLIYAVHFYPEIYRKYIKREVTDKVEEKDA